MANDINVNNPVSVLNTTQRGLNQPAHGADRGSAAATAPQSADRVSMTSEATRLQEIEEQLLNVPEVNSAKVAEIKAAIANGTFEINPLRIAEKLIAFESGTRNQ
jgi:negative regulator of flagellin synthesis FlgM